MMLVRIGRGIANAVSLMAVVFAPLATEYGDSFLVTEDGFPLVRS